MMKTVTDTYPGQRRKAAADTVDAPDRDALLQAVIGVCPEGIVVIDADSIIREFNPQAEKMFGFGADLAVGQNVALLIPAPRRAEHRDFVAHYLATGESGIIGKPRESVARRADGSLFPVEITVQEIDVGGARLFAGFMRDISPRKRAEGELRKLTADLAHAGRIAVMGEMAAAITHEINQPLTAMSNYVAAGRHMLRKPGTRMEAIADIMAKAEQQVTRARDIVAHFRSFLRKGQPDWRAEDLNSLVESALALALVNAGERGVRTEVHLAPDLPPVLADGVQIQQVVLNLLRNAVEALGEVTDRRLAVTTARRDDEAAVAFAIRDSGPGLAPEIRDRLFQPFLTTKKDGTGIGLSLCRSIMTIHKGRIWAEPNDWGGTTFCCSLPVAQGTDA
jgi:two-component system sensor kinase FixL